MDSVIRERLVALVLVAAAFSSSAVRAQFDAPINSRELARDFSQAHSAGEYKEAIAIGLRWVRMKPKDDGAAYNLACAYALNGDVEEALEYLRKSVTNGWNDPGHMKRDGDLESLTELAEFAEIVELARDEAKERYDIARRSEPVVITPPEYDGSKAVPLIIAMHGYGSNADNFAKLWKDAAAEVGAILAAPKSIMAINLGGGMSWNNPEEAEIAVLSALEKVREGYKIDADRVVITGFSQGGMMALHIALRHPDKFRGVIAVAAQYDPKIASVADLSSPGDLRFFLMTGEDDRGHILRSVEQLESELKAAGVPVTSERYADLGHALPVNRDEEFVKAVKNVLGR